MVRIRFVRTLAAGEPTDYRRRNQRKSCSRLVHLRRVGPYGDQSDPQRTGNGILRVRYDRTHERRHLAFVQLCARLRAERRGGSRAASGRERQRHALGFGYVNGQSLRLCIRPCGPAPIGGLQATLRRRMESVRELSGRRTDLRSERQYPLGSADRWQRGELARADLYVRRLPSDLGRRKRDRLGRLPL